MFNKIKNLLFPKWIEESDKEVIICIHGFGRRKAHEYDNFLLWNNDVKNIITFDIYDADNVEDCNSSLWIRRCEDMVAYYYEQQYKITLIGFSMGGVLATHCARLFPIEKLFLIAPAFDYFHVGNLMNTAISLLKKEEKKVPSMTADFTQCFMDVIKACKDDVIHVACPVCFVHGDKDEVIPLRSSINSYEKIPHKTKRLFIIHNGKHSLMRYPQTAWETYQLLLLFLNGIILGEDNIQFTKDIFLDEMDIEKEENPHE